MSKLVLMLTGQSFCYREAAFCLWANTLMSLVFQLILYALSYCVDGKGDYRPDFATRCRSVSVSGFATTGWG